MGKLRYIFCDLDGTLLHSDKTMSMKTVAYLRELKKRKDIVVGIASGRAPSSIQPMIQRYEMEDVIDVIIANNGVDTISSHTKNEKRRGMIQKDTIQKIIQEFADYPDITVSFHNPGVLYATNVTRRVHGILKMNDMHLVLDPRKDLSYLTAPRVMLLFQPVNRSLVEEAVARHPIDGLKGYFAEEDIYEFTSKEVSKHKAIEAYVQQFGHELSDVMVFGDSGNDIGMLQACGLGIVMKNGEENIQAYGDLVSDATNDEDGIYEFLHRHESLLLEKENIL